MSKFTIHAPVGWDKLDKDLKQWGFMADSEIKDIVKESAQGALFEAQTYEASERGGYHRTGATNRSWGLRGSKASGEWAIHSDYRGAFYTRVAQPWWHVGRWNTLEKIVTKWMDVRKDVIKAVRAAARKSGVFK